MQIENQCCTPEQGIKLAALGINEPQYFVWTNGEVVPFLSLGDNMDGENNVFYDAPTFTVAELGVMLPAYLNESDDVYFDTQKLSNGKWMCCYVGHAISSEQTEAQARTALLIHLLENNHITASECNERLKSA